MLGEIGIIVVGIVIAIGLEQVVEQVHGAQEAREARASIRSEIDRDDSYFAFRIAAMPCIARRLDAVEAVTEQIARHAPAPALGL